MRESSKQISFFGKKYDIIVHMVNFTVTNEQISVMTLAKHAHARAKKRIRADLLQIDREKRAIEMAVIQGDNTMRRLMRVTGLNRQKLGRRLVLLVQQDRLWMVYKGRGTYYEVPASVIV